MSDFNILLDQTVRSGTEEQLYLQQLSDRYPWFTLGQYMLFSAVSQSNPEQGQMIYNSLTPRIAINGYPALLTVVPDDLFEVEPLPNQEYVEQFNYQPDQYDTPIEEQYDLIDQFLDRQITRITPSNPYDDYPENEDISMESVEYDNEIISETLAEIYLRQGHKDKAADIYYKLSLKYPKKSIYFANRIDDIGRTLL